MQGAATPAQSKRRPTPVPGTLLTHAAELHAALGLVVVMGAEGPVMDAGAMDAVMGVWLRRIRRLVRMVRSGVVRRLRLALL